MSQETVPTPQPKEINTTNHWLVDFLWKEWRVIKSPSFWVAIGIVAIVLFWLEERHYEVILAENNAQIQLLQTRQGAEDATHKLSTSPIIESAQTQLHLHIKSLQYIRASNSSPAVVTPFRILALADRQQIVFPQGTGMAYYYDISTNETSAYDSAPFYRLQIFSENITVSFSTTHSEHGSTNIFATVYGTQDQFALTNLPASGTNLVNVSLGGFNSAVGLLRIKYEIIK